ncbi:hypothetical protein [Pseudomonas putida]|uniref:Uncharacterized protein n=1 Tax=Pseudomonas putida TaxID=303 RepID=A0A1Q9QX66_PSEPU|nr:hypothetical protein [Pseudomonas putida]OLS59743.1 hypothetical protein PSEMO_53890 [Pseudomonas putida]
MKIETGKALVTIVLLMSDRGHASDNHYETKKLSFTKTEDHGQLLVYTLPKGGELKIFDDGLKFYYDNGILITYDSPDRLHSMIPLSEPGILYDAEGVEQSAISLNLCAFIRLKDGCITSVETGSQCGGEWNEDHIWSSLASENNEYLLENKTDVNEIYKNYASRSRDGTRISSPRVLSYLMEGTGFDNLLACDPPTLENHKAYSDFMNLLRNEGDIENAKKIESEIAEVTHAHGTYKTKEIP